MKAYKTIFGLLFILAILFTVLHLVLLVISNTMSIGIESILLNVLPYGLPIWIFAATRRACIADKPHWSKVGFVMMTLFTFAFLAMVTHVTLAYFYSNEAFINIYFNVPLLYSAPLILFAVLWAGMKNKVTVKGERTGAGKVISALPILVLGVMVVHVGAVSVMEIARQINGPLSTSAPWWVMPLLIAFVYIAVLGIALLIRGIYNRVKG